MYNKEETEYLEELKKKKEEAIYKFKAIITDPIMREDLKVLAYYTGIVDFRILSHWSRSIVACDYDLEHPDYLEYKRYYQVNVPWEAETVPWLEKGYTYVKMKEYKEWKNAKRCKI